MELQLELDLLKNVTPIQACVLSVVDKLKDKDGICRLSHKEIGKILGIARPNASRAIAALCKAEYLEKTDRGRSIKVLALQKK